MKSFKLQRNIWMFSGTCFLLSIILFLSAGTAFDLRYFFLTIASVASFINAYNLHKKI